MSDIVVLRSLLRNRLLEIGHKKPLSFRFVDAQSTIALTPEELNSIPHKTYDELESPCSDLPTTEDGNEHPILFVLHRNGKKYLVSTEGYTYSRYIIRISMLTPSN